MKKVKAKIRTSLELVGTSLLLENVVYSEIPKVDGALPFLRITRMDDQVFILKTTGFLGDFGDGHRFDFKFNRQNGQDLPPEIHTGHGVVHKVTVFTGIQQNIFIYAIEGMSDGDLRITLSDDFLGTWKHTDIAGFLFTREVL